MKREEIVEVVKQVLAEMGITHGGVTTQDSGGGGTSNPPPPKPGNG